MAEKKDNMISTEAAPEKDVPQKSSKKEEKKPNFFVRMGRRLKQYFKELRSDVKKITWPSAKQVRKNTLIVLATIVIVVVCIFAFDTVIGFLRNLILGF